MVDFPLSPLPETIPAAPSRVRRRMAVLLRAALAVVAVAAALFALAAIRLSRGVPERWTALLGEKISTDEIDIEPEHVSFSLARLSLRVGALGVYRKSEVREPVVKAAGVEVAFRPRSLMPSPAWLASAKVDSLELSIDLGGGGEEDDEDSGSSAVELPDIPPVPVKCGRVDVLGFRGRSVEAVVSCTGGVLRVDGIRIAFPEETASGQAVRGSLTIALDPFDISAECAGCLDPNVVCPVLYLAREPDIAAELEKFAFPDMAPDLDATYRYCAEKNERSLRIKVSSGPASYNGVEVRSFSGIVSVGKPDGWGYVEIAHLSVERPEGAASCSLEIAPAEDALRFSASATMDPLALAALIGLVGSEDALPAEFPSPAQVRGSGTFAIGSDSTNDLSVEVFAPETLVAGVPLRRVSAALSLKGDDLRVDDIRADILGGDLSAAFALALPFSSAAPTNLPAQIDITLSALSFAEISRLANPESPVTKGAVTASLSLGGPLDDISGLTFAESEGTISLDAHDSRIYRIPVFAGLTDILASFVPGVDWLVDEDNFSVRGEFGGGKLRVDPFNIDGAAVSVSGRGNVYFPELDVDIKAKVHLLNRSTWLGEGIYWLLSPISKIFEIRATGPATSPRWTSATFQSNPSKK